MTRSIPIALHHVSGTEARGIERAAGRHLHLVGCRLDGCWTRCAQNRQSIHSVLFSDLDAVHQPRRSCSIAHGFAVIGDALLRRNAPSQPDQQHQSDALHGSVLPLGIVSLDWLRVRFNVAATLASEAA